MKTKEDIIISCFLLMTTTIPASGQSAGTKLWEFTRWRSLQWTHLCSREVTHPAEGRKDFFSKKERFGSEEGDSEQASRHPEREAGSAGRISGCADATDRSSLWRGDAGAGWTDEAHACVGP